MRKLFALVCLCVVLAAPAVSAQTTDPNPEPILCGIGHTPLTNEDPCADPGQTTNGIGHTPLTGEDESVTTAAVLLGGVTVILSVTIY